MCGRRPCARSAWRIASAARPAGSARPASARAPIIRPFQPTRALSSSPGRGRAARRASSSSSSSSKSPPTSWRRCKMFFPVAWPVASSRKLPSGRALEGFGDLSAEAHRRARCRYAPFLRVALRVEGVGVEGGVEEALGGGHLAVEPRDDAARRAGEESRLAGGSISDAIGGGAGEIAQHEGVVVEHLLEVRQEPVGRRCCSGGSRRQRDRGCRRGTIALQGDEGHREGGLALLIGGEVAQGVDRGGDPIAVWGGNLGAGPKPPRLGVEGPCDLGLEGGGVEAPDRKRR